MTTRFGLTAALFLSACAPLVPRHVPSTAPISNAIANARQRNDEAQHHNDRARTFGDRIEAKAVVIDRYWEQPK